MPRTRRSVLSPAASPPLPCKPLARASDAPCSQPADSGGRAHLAGCSSAATPSAADARACPAVHAHSSQLRGTPRVRRRWALEAHPTTAEGRSSCGAARPCTCVLKPMKFIQIYFSTSLRKTFYHTADTF